MPISTVVTFVRVHNLIVFFQHVSCAIQSVILSAVLGEWLSCRTAVAWSAFPMATVAVTTRSAFTMTTHHEMHGLSMLCVYGCLPSCFVCCCGICLQLVYIVVFFVVSSGNLSTPSSTSFSGVITHFLCYKSFWVVTSTTINRMFFSFFSSFSSSFFRVRDEVLNETLIRPRKAFS